MLKFKEIEKSLSLSLKDNDELPLQEKVGRNPITLEKRRIKEWLEENNNNLVLLYNENIILTSKNEFAIPNIRDIYLDCVIENKQLMVKQTVNAKTDYFSLKYITGENIIINYKNIVKLIKTYNIINLDTLYTNSFISRERLINSLIGIKLKKIDKFKDKEDKEDNLKNEINLPYKDDIYFDETISSALFNYSYQWDSAINNFLRFGLSYFETKIFKSYYTRYGKTLDIAIYAIKSKIEVLDRAFMDYAPRNENNRTLYYRGMKNKFGELNNIGDKQIVPNFMSITTNISIAKAFSSKKNKCCIYLIQLDKGIPFINMISTTKFKDENEILLPRNLMITLTGINDDQFSKYLIQISAIDNNQFKKLNVCEIYEICILKGIKLSKHDISIKDKKTELQEIEYEIKNNPIPNIKRCPNGTRKNKITKLCEKTTIENPYKNNSTPNKKRCPNGTRKNKITKICETKT
jgi:hypothetical protein